MYIPTLPYPTLKQLRSFLSMVQFYRDIWKRKKPHLGSLDRPCKSWQDKKSKEQTKNRDLRQKVKTNPNHFPKTVIDQVKIVT